MRAHEIEEAIRGYLPNPSFPDFSKAMHAFDVDGYRVMATPFDSNYYAYGILDDSGEIMSYVIISSEHDGVHDLREIYTSPKYRGKNLSATILMSLKAKDNVTLILDKDEKLSNDGRQLLLKMVKNKKISAKHLDNTIISADELESMFKSDNFESILFEGMKFLSWEKRYRKDEVLTERWRLRDQTEELYD